MSFWPFGSVVTDSHIEQKIDEYFHVFHAVERSLSQEKEGKDHISLSAIQSDPSDDDPTSDLNHLHIHNSNTRIDQKSIRSDRSSFSSIFRSSEHPEPPIELPYYNLSEEFILEILHEPNLIDELIKENSRLLDFICFGYFYRDDGPEVKHLHIDYIIDKLLENLELLQDVPSDSQHDEIILGQHSDQEVTRLQTVDEVDRLDISEGEESPIGSPASEILEESATHMNIYSEIGVFSDILTLNNSLINRVVIDDHTRMSKLWNIINHPDITSVDSPHIRIFLKLHDAFLANRKNSYLNFIRSRPTILDDFFKKDTFPAIFEFLLRLICTDKPGDPSGILDLVEEQCLIPRCVKYLQKNEIVDTAQITISDFLRQLIELSVNIPVNDISIGPNNLTRELVSEPIISNLIQVMLDQRGKVLSHIIVLTIEIIRKNNSDFDQINLISSTISEHPPSKRDPLYLGYLLDCYTKHLPQLLDIIWDVETITNEDEPNIPNNACVIGMTRIKILELLAELLHCSNMESLNSNVAHEKETHRETIRQAVTREINCMLKPNSSFDSEEPSDLGKTHEKMSLPSLCEEFKNLSTEYDDIPYVSAEGNTILRNQNTVGNRFKFVLYDSEVIPRLLKIFLSHSFNNFWHNVIFDILQQLFNNSVTNSYGPFLIYSLFCLDKSRQYQAIPSADQAEKKEDFNIVTDFILDGYKRSHEHYQEKSVSLGYSGHLLLIAEDMATFAATKNIDNISPDVSIALQNEKWIKLSHSIIPMMKEMCSRILGGGECVEDDNGNITLQIHMQDVNDPHRDDKEESEKFNQMLSETCCTQDDVDNKLSTLWP